MTVSDRGRPCWVLATEAAAILASATFWMLIAERVQFFTLIVNDAFLCLFTLFCGIVLADAVSGFVHWFCDTFFEETTPLIGPRLIASFREHHRDPQAMTRHTLLELNGTNCIGLTPVLALAWWLGPVQPQSTAVVFGYSLLLAFSAAITLTNQLHCWAHHPKPPGLVRMLQRSGLALSPEHHARHHAPPHRSAYCVTNGWFNKLADRFSLFVYAERLFVALGLPQRIRTEG